MRGRLPGDINSPDDAGRFFTLPLASALDRAIPDRGGISERFLIAIKNLTEPSCTSRNIIRIQCAVETTWTRAIIVRRRHGRDSDGIDESDR